MGILDFREISVKQKKVKKYHDVLVTNIDTVEVHIKHLANDDFTNHMQFLMRPYKRIEKTMSDEKYLDIVTPAIAKYILVDWDNLVLPKAVVKEDFPDFDYKPNKDGNIKIPYSYKNCKNILEHKNWNNFRLTIFDLAKEREDFLKRDLEGKEKN